MRVRHSKREREPEPAHSGISAGASRSAPRQEVKVDTVKRVHSNAAAVYQVISKAVSASALDVMVPGWKTQLLPPPSVDATPDSPAAYVCAHFTLKEIAYVVQVERSGPSRFRGEFVN